MNGPKHKGLAAWLALLLGALGVHRFYLYGLQDRWGWLHALPTGLAIAGFQPVEQLGVDAPSLTWALPLFGGMTALACLSAIVMALTPDERWNQRHNPVQPAAPSRWAPILAAIFALMLGGIALMVSIAFTAQRYFELSAAA